MLLAALVVHGCFVATFWLVAGPARDAIERDPLILHLLGHDVSMLEAIDSVRILAPSEIRLTGDARRVSGIQECAPFRSVFPCFPMNFRLPFRISVFFHEFPSSVLYFRVPVSVFGTQLDPHIPCLCHSSLYYSFFMIHGTLPWLLFHLAFES
jgi:hypothetical protein